MKPKAWSWTALEGFENCPKQFYETRVLKDKHPFVETAEMKWGKEVHKAFENHVLYRSPLPADLAMHQEFLDSFLAQPGVASAEQRIALDTAMRPCKYFDKAVEVWWRGQVDASKRDLAAGYSHLVDWKTGKVKNNYDQLKLFAIWEFIAHPEINTVKIEYYWTQIKGSNGETYTRDQLPELIRYFIPRLHRFADAFLQNVFNPKQSGLCNGWCPVTDCEFWRPKRVKP